MRNLAICVVMVLFSCNHPKAQDSAANDAGPNPAPLDRLLPGELAKSGLLVFGFPVPQGMYVKRRYPESVHLEGPISAGLLTRFVEAHATVESSELIGRRKVYKNARIVGGDPGHQYTIEVDDVGGERQLLITDSTPRKPEPGLSNDERWRRAGYLPDGTPIASAQSM